MNGRDAATLVLFTVPGGHSAHPCSRCGKPIYWIRADSGRKLAIDCDTDPNAKRPTPFRRRGTLLEGQGTNHFIDCHPVHR